MEAVRGVFGAVGRLSRFGNLFLEGSGSLLDLPVLVQALTRRGRRDARPYRLKAVSLGAVSTWFMVAPGPGGIQSAPNCTRPVVSSLNLVDEPTVVNSTMVEFQLAIGLVKNSLTLEMQPTHPCSAAAPEGSAAMSSQAEIALDEQQANDIRRRRLSCRD